MRHIFADLDRMLRQIGAILFSRVSIQSASFVTVRLTGSGGMHRTKKPLLAMTRIKTFYGNLRFLILKG